MEVYLDNAATTRVCPEAADIAYKVMTECYGNPSSTHTKGREAKTYLDTARSQIAAALGCSASEVYFTSCGSESDVWAITKGAESMSRRGKHIISSAVEHDAVRKTLEDLGARGFEVTYLAPEKDGAISVESVKNALREDTILVTLMMVNNETGGITDIAGIAKMLKAEGSKALLHTDAVQEGAVFRKKARRGHDKHQRPQNSRAEGHRRIVYQNRGQNQAPHSRRRSGERHACRHRGHAADSCLRQGVRDRLCRHAG